MLRQQHHRLLLHGVFYCSDHRMKKSELQREVRLSSLKCPQLRLVNFADATSCKRCQLSLEPASSSGGPSSENAVARG